MEMALINERPQRSLHNAVTWSNFLMQQRRKLLAALTAVDISRLWINPCGYH